MAIYTKYTVIIIPVILLGLVVFYIYQDSTIEDQGTYSTCSDVTLSGIKVIIEQIKDTEKQYVREQKDINDLSAEGGQQTSYSDANGELKLVKQVFFGETGKSEAEYYYQNSSPIYIVKSNYVYEQPITIDSSGFISEKETKEFLLSEDHSVCEWYLDGSLQMNSSETQELVNFLIDSI